MIQVMLLLGATAAAALRTVRMLWPIAPAYPALCGWLYDPLLLLLLVGACICHGLFCKADVCIVIIMLPFGSIACWGSIMAEDAGWCLESKARCCRVVVVLVVPVLLLWLGVHGHLGMPDAA